MLSRSAPFYPLSSITISFFLTPCFLPFAASGGQLAIKDTLNFPCHIDCFCHRCVGTLPCNCTFHRQVVDNLRENNLKVQEIRVMMHLRHRNIVEMCDFYTSNQQLCIVMSYADGGDLRNEVIKARNGKTTISEELITVWLIQVILVLHARQE